MQSIWMCWYTGCVCYSSAETHTRKRSLGWERKNTAQKWRSLQLETGCSKTQHKNEDRCSLRQAVQKHSTKMKIAAAWDRLFKNTAQKWRSLQLETGCSKTQHKNEDRCSLRQAVQKHAALKTWSWAPIKVATKRVCALFIIIRVISRKHKMTIKCEFISESCIHSDKDCNFLLKKKKLSYS